MKFKKCLLPVAMLASFTLAGCQSNADDHAADVYPGRRWSDRDLE